MPPGGGGTVVLQRGLDHIVASSLVSYFDPTSTTGKVDIYLQLYVNQSTWHVMARISIRRL